MAISLTNNRGPIINIAMWIILVPTVMTVAAKLATKWYTAKKMMVDDICMIIAFLAAIAQSVAITEEVKFGLGRREVTLSNGDMNKILVAQYISNVFYMISIYTTKLSLAFFFIHLCVHDAAQQVVKWTISFMCIWLLTSVVLLLAQCHLPHPWDSFGTTCIDMKAFWTVSLVVDVITQVVVALLPIYLLNGLHMSNKFNKWLSMAVFVPNLLVVPLAVLRLVFLLQARDSSDFTWESFNFGILTSFQPFVSIMVASMPFAKPLLDSLILQPYLIAVEEPQSVIPRNSKSTSWAQRIQNSYSSRTQKLPRGLRSFKSRKDSSAQWPYSETQEDQVDLVNGQEFNMRNYTSVSGKKVMVDGHMIPGGEVGENRVSAIDEMVISQTKTAAVEIN